MSLAIQLHDVTAVLLRDGWHQVVDQSFDVDDYEFLDGETLRVGGGQVEGVSPTGAAWKERDGSWFACPLPRILAVRYKIRSEKLRLTSGRHGP